MAYKEFRPGEEALADDVNDYLMSQTVSRFPTAATRASLLTAPVVNQLSMTDDRPGQVQYWNGAGWVDLIPPVPIVAGYHLQHVNFVATTDQYGGMSSPFPVAFGPGEQPTAVVTEASGNDVSADIFECTASVVFVNCRVPGGAPMANSMLRVMCLAVGRR
jgi:hypothetical protein